MGGELLCVCLVSKLGHIVTEWVRPASVDGRNEDAERMERVLGMLNM